MTARSSNHTHRDGMERVLLSRHDGQTPEVLIPNFKRRLSGVTSTVVWLVPIQQRMIGLATVGVGLPSGFPHLSLASLLAMPRSQEDGRPRVWHARRNSEMLGGVALKWLLGKRLRLVFTSASQRRHSWITKWLVGRMDVVIAASEASARYLDRTSTVIMHGIDTAQFAPVGTERRALLRRRLGLPEHGAIVGCYGRIRHQKGTDVFVEAMISLAARDPDLVAVVMGRATGEHRSYDEDLRRRVQAAGLSDRILFRPEVPTEQMPAWYQVLDLFIAPQRSEGFGLTPLEAMACGVPVIATRVGAFPGIVRDRLTGALVPPGDAAALGGAAAHSLGDPALRKAAGEAARARSLDEFCITREAEAIVGVYRRLLDNECGAAVGAVS